MQFSVSHLTEFPVNKTLKILTSKMLITQCNIQFIPLSFWNIEFISLEICKSDQETCAENLRRSPGEKKIQYKTYVN